MTGCQVPDTTVLVGNVILLTAATLSLFLSVCFPMSKNMKLTNSEQIFYQSAQCVVTTKAFGVGTVISNSILQTTGLELFNY
jgi:hypothetical protein